MRHRCLASMGVLAVVIAVLSLAPVPVAGQAPSPAATTTAAADAWTLPRTPWGEPDLQGVWDFNTATPLQRPRELAGKQVFTEDEVAAREEEVAAREEQVAQGRIDGAPREFVLASYNRFWTDRGRVLTRTSLIVDPPDGRIPPLTPEAAKRQAAAVEARSGVGRDEPTPGGWVETIRVEARCIVGFNSGPPIEPRGYNQNVQLFQIPGYVVILTEMIHDARIVPLDGRPHGTIRQWAGDSRGHWEGNTLVVDTTNFLRELQPRVDEFRTSLRFSANMHLVERFTRVDADTLLYEFTVEDPTTWTRTWTAQVPMRKSQDKMYEYACHEGNYGLYNILAGVRAKEQAEEVAKTRSK